MWPIVWAHCPRLQARNNLMSTLPVNNNSTSHNVKKNTTNPAHQESLPWRSMLFVFSVDFIGGFDTFSSYQPPSKSSHIQLQPVYVYVSLAISSFSSLLFNFCVDSYLIGSRCVIWHPYGYFCTRAIIRLQNWTKLEHYVSRVGPCSWHLYGHFCTSSIIN